jgi:hypothetical protein
MLQPDVNMDESATINDAYDDDDDDGDEDGSDGDGSNHRGGVGGSGEGPFGGFFGGSLVVEQSLFRALTTSFGSVCVGSLLVAVIKTLQALVRRLRNSVRNSAGKRSEVCECVVGVA